MKNIQKILIKLHYHWQIVSLLVTDYIQFRIKALCVYTQTNKQTTNKNIYSPDAIHIKNYLYIKLYYWHHEGSARAQDEHLRQAEQHIHDG